MLMVDIMTFNGSQSSIAAPQIAALRSGLRGAVLLAGDEGYEAARRVWNGNVDRRPGGDRAVPERRRRPARGGLCRERGLAACRSAAAATAPPAMAPTTAAWSSTCRR